MLMTTGRLIALRLFNISLGRSAWANKVLRRLLVRALIGRQKRDARYMASSRFFQMSELN
ncbi:MAG: hypothetical protein OJJ21_13310 [Ferrovibrio sp.]|uniref:hypothetical protein n=1 Tax=Ferrovibrio sp. TaxID=1917215 RepID=UPI00261C03B9|nr:hypothetical protein [Ferrovibrio sp.]MCW0234573.1 hypothetical protein [Ferrovibrio sp.]